MSEKIWKIFGVFGIVCLIGILILAALGLFLGVFREAPEIYAPQRHALFAPAAAPLRTPFPKKAALQEEIQNELQPLVPSRMIIKTGWLNLVVKNVLETVKKISEFATNSGGWVVSTDISEYEKVPSGSITVRVPAEKFDEAMNYFRALAVRVSNEKTQAQDITEEYVDLEARLRNLKSSEEQLLELMKRTGKVSEILEVQRELTNVRQQIEQIKGRMQYLEQSVKMSAITVNLALSEELLPIPPAEKWRPKYVFLQALKSVLNFWKEFSYFIIRLAIWAQVWVPLVIIVWYLRKVWKKKKRG